MHYDIINDDDIDNDDDNGDDDDDDDGVPLIKRNISQISEQRSVSL